MTWEGVKILYPEFWVFDGPGSRYDIGWKKLQIQFVLPPVSCIFEECKWDTSTTLFVTDSLAYTNIYPYNYRLCCVMENTEIWLADTRNKVTFMFA